MKKIWAALVFTLFVEVIAACSPDGTESWIVSIEGFIAAWFVGYALVWLALFTTSRLQRNYDAWQRRQMRILLEELRK